MRRGAAGTERVVVFVMGLLLLAAGAAAVAWRQDWISGAVDQLDAGPVLDWTDTRWWPWAVGGAGIVLTVVGVAWLAAHLRRRTVHRLELSGSGRGGRLTVSCDALVESARDTLEGATGLQLRSGRVIVDERGERLVDLRAGIDPGADLGEATDAARHASAVLSAQVGLESGLRYRIVLTGRGTTSKTSRVQ
ncbi:hypothetical protein [Phytoactinopolyspora limicola]|uniref:hypothetical protein n=1 Tax=Phytoactinopolyspora limicola TaxID=2715536 RepID=UPI001408EEB9|nr:hypothetical protein [Phytoactinopolyspora limicola]